MHTKAIQKQKEISDSDQTIAEIRALRREWSEKYKTDEEILRFQQGIHEELERLAGRKIKYVDR